MRQPRRRGELDPHLALGAYRLGAGELGQALHPALRLLGLAGLGLETVDEALQVRAFDLFLVVRDLLLAQLLGALALEGGVVADVQLRAAALQVQGRSEEHTSELQSLMRISYAVFCLKKKTHKYIHTCIYDLTT